AQRRHLQRAAPESYCRGSHDWQQVEGREVAGDTTGDVNERGDEKRIDAKLRVGDPRMPIDNPQRPEVQDTERVGDPDQKEERVDGKRTGPVDLNENRRAEQQRADDDTDGDERRQTRS